MLAGPVDGRTGRWLDVRWPEPASPSGMGRVFLPAVALDQAGMLVERVARHVDVFIGIALHDREAGDGTSVSRSHLVWTDIDREDAQTTLDRFAHPPTMTVASGIICSRRTQVPGAAGDGCWRHVADRALAGNGRLRRR
jgi:hypothetical protein